MLILTRRLGETLIIGDNVTVTVLGVKRNQVRVGINAPKHVAVHREEIYRRLLAEALGEHLGGKNSGDALRLNTDGTAGVGGGLELRLESQSSTPPPVEPPWDNRQSDQCKRNPARTRTR